MDGVLADFVAGAAHAHGKSPMCPPEQIGVFEIEKWWGISARKFWEPINDYPDFWVNLPKTPEADAIVQLATDVFGEGNVAVLTAPALGWFCIPGKQEWLRKYYPKLPVLFGSAKQFCAAPHRWLLDDQDKNMEAFDAAGGVGVLVPRLWNSAYADAGRVMERLREDLSLVN